MPSFAKRAHIVPRCRSATLRRPAASPTPAGDAPEPPPSDQLLKLLTCLPMLLNQLVQVIAEERHAQNDEQRDEGNEDGVLRRGRAALLVTELRDAELDGDDQLEKLVHNFPPLGHRPEPPRRSDGAMPTFAANHCVRRAAPAAGDRTGFDRPNDRHVGRMADISGRTVRISGF